MPLYNQKPFISSMGSIVRVAIIGAGPAGSLAAIFLSDYAKRKRKTFEITLYEGKDFKKKGQCNCNLCAGVISNNLHQELNDIGIDMTKTIQCKVAGYRLYLGCESILLSKNDPNIFTVNRAKGPVDASAHSFDQLLLDEALRRKDVSLKRRYVSSLHHDQGWSLSCGGKEYRHDLVIVATGVNSPILKQLERTGYKRPDTLWTRLVELKEDVLHPDTRRDEIHVLPVQNMKDVDYAILIPKKRHLTLNLVGKKGALQIGMSDVWKVMVMMSERGLFRHDLKKDSILCSCSPMTSVSAAKNPISDGLIMLGDAGVSRYLKNGLLIALLSARQASRTIVDYGISKKELKRGYLRFYRRLASDMSYGRFLFWCFEKMKNRPAILKKPKKEILDMLWDLHTGNLSYKEIFFSMIRPKIFWKIFFG